MNKDGVWQALENAYAQNGIVLTLGAGVSHDSNIPSWEKLLSGMVEDYVKDADGNTFKKLQKNHLPLPAIASLLEEHCGSRTNFVKRVRDALYADFPFYNTKIDKYNRGDFKKFIQEGRVKNKAEGNNSIKCRSNPTLRSIGAFCMVKSTETNSRGKLIHRNIANQKVRAIVTLNMDALLQTYISTFTTDRIVRTVERSSAEPFPDSINIYHMHGYLHFNPAEKSHKKDSAESVVLTEQDYYDFFNQPNSMFNYTFLYLLREYSCLFIGLSMQDENIRRLLHYSKLERMRSLANKMDISVERLVGRGTLIDKEIKRHFVIMLSNADPQVNRANEETLGALGVNIIWVKKFSEIPGLMERLYKSNPKDGKYWANLYGKEMG